MTSNAFWVMMELSIVVSVFCAAIIAAWVIL